MNACLMLHDERLAGQYMTDVKNLLAEFSWVYDWKLTRFFVDRVWERCPVDWLHALLGLGADQLSQIASSSGQSMDLPKSLRHYIGECQRLSIVGRCPQHFSASSPVYDRRKISAKKQHEFDQLVPMLVELCRKHEISQIIDIGCGIGHLSMILAQEYGWKVVGIECDQSHCDKATSKATGGVHFVQMSVDANSGQLLWDLITGNQKAAIVALHCCGDLHVSILKLVAESPANVRLCIAIPCCYLKMALDSDGCATSFPLGIDGDWRLSRYALRLASQAAFVTWERQSADDHRFHCNNVAFRAIVEVANTRGLNIEKRKRHFARRSDFTDFDAFVAAISRRCSVPDFDHAKAILLDIKDEFDPFVKFIQPMTALQALMQPVVESLIVLDRGLFALHGCSAASVNIESLFDPLLSPRNSAVVVSKDE